MYVGIHAGMCAMNSDGGGRTWRQGPVTQPPYAAVRVAGSPIKPQRAWLGRLRGGHLPHDDGGVTWKHVQSYPSDYAHSVLAEAYKADALYISSEPAALFRPEYAGQSRFKWIQLGGSTALLQ